MSLELRIIPVVEDGVVTGELKEIELDSGTALWIKTRAGRLLCVTVYDDDVHLGVYDGRRVNVSLPQASELTESRY